MEFRLSESSSDCASIKSLTAKPGANWERIHTVSIITENFEEMSTGSFLSKQARSNPSTIGRKSKDLQTNNKCILCEIF
jgi:hypothetical protein